MIKDINILIAGVGGQGTLLASRVLGNFALNSGLDCKLSEVHGMSQRGGSVVTYVRMGEKVMSPIITEGEADYVLAFELLEALRWSHYAKKEGLILVNDCKIMPMPVITGAAAYLSDILETLKKDGKAFKIIDALKLAKEAGSAKAVNVVMLGGLFKLMGVPFDTAAEALYKSIPQKHLAKFKDINTAALRLGYGE